MISGSIYKNKNNKEVIWINIFGTRVTIFSKKNKIVPFNNEEEKDTNLTEETFVSKQAKLTSSFSLKNRPGIFDKLFNTERSQFDDSEDLPQLIRRKSFSYTIKKLIQKEIKENSNTNNLELNLIDDFLWANRAVSPSDDIPKANNSFRVCK